MLPSLNKVLLYFTLLYVVVSPRTTFPTTGVSVCVERNFSDLNSLLNTLNSFQTEGVYFVSCPKQGFEMEAVVLKQLFCI